MDDFVTKIRLPVDPDICIYRNQPVIASLIKIRRASTRVMPPWLVCFTIVFLTVSLPKIGFALYTGRFGSNSAPTDDFRTLFSDRVGGGTGVPLLRDYADWCISILMAAHTAFMARQWERLDRFPRLLQTENMVRVDVSGWRQHLRKFDGRFNHKAYEWLALLPAAALAVLLLAAAAGQGIYWWMDIDATGDAAAAHFRDWWAYPGSNLPGFLLQYLVYTFYLYLLFRHTIMGGIAVWFGVKAGRLEEDGQWIGYSSSSRRDPDSIAEMRGAINDVFISITLMLSTLLVANWYIHFPQSLDLLFVLPYTVVNLVFVIAPWLIFNEQIHRSKRTRIQIAEGGVEQAQRNIDSSGATPQMVSQLQVATIDLQHAHALRSKVIDSWSIVRGFLGYLAPVILWGVSYFFARH